MTPEEAREQYTVAWLAYRLLTTERDTMTKLERMMDEAQPFIAASPSDPAWKEFVKTLPGFPMRQRKDAVRKTDR
jgi:hypothetical protein